MALAAIRDLYQVVQEKDAQLAGQHEQIRVLQQQNRALEGRLAAIEAKIAAMGK